jgi:hypothetical protein
MKKIISKNQGFVQMILVAIVIIATLAYFNVDVRGILDNPGVKKVWDVLRGAWINYLMPLFTYLWTSVASIFPAR